MTHHPFRRCDGRARLACAQHVGDSPCVGGQWRQRCVTAGLAAEAASAAMAADRTDRAIELLNEPGSQGVDVHVGTGFLAESAEQDTFMNAARAFHPRRPRPAIKVNMRRDDGMRLPEIVESWWAWAP